MFWITWPDWVEDYTQWVLNIHMSLECGTWVYKDENNIEKVSIIQGKKNVNKDMYK